MSKPPAKTPSTLNGWLDGVREEDPAHVRVYWGLADGGRDPSAWPNHLDLGNHTNGDLAAVLSYLTEGTVYYYRLYARDSSQGVWASTTEHFTAQATVVTFQEGDLWRYFEGYTFPGKTWNALDFNDQDWLEGPTGIGYGDGDDQTVVDMERKYITLYMRRYFQVDDPNGVVQMRFTVDYDDGFVAFINGREPLLLRREECQNSR